MVKSMAFSGIKTDDSISVGTVKESKVWIEKWENYEEYLKREGLKVWDGNKLIKDSVYVVKARSLVVRVSVLCLGYSDHVREDVSLIPSDA